MKKCLGRRVVSEFVGTMYLVAVIIGSGIMGDALSNDDGVALLGNTLATWGILYVLISSLGPISGAHFNPVVSSAFFFKRELHGIDYILYIIAQVAGGILGAYLAHGMFMKRNGEFDGKDRDTDGEFFSEFIATIGLLSTIFGFIAAKADVAMGVGLYITAGYWFTSSTSFANPAVTIARSFTDTFASISPKSFLAYFLGQFLGLVFALPACEWLFNDQSPLTSVLTIFRASPLKPFASNLKRDSAYTDIEAATADDPSTETRAVSSQQNNTQTPDTTKTEDHIPAAANTTLPSTT